MKKIFLVGFLMLFLFAFARAEKQSIVKLKLGKNEVSIKIINMSKIDFESVEIVVKKNNIPEGMSIAKKAQNVDLYANRKSENGLIL